eukprot:SAG22_NODE_68_length_22846_cov_32.458258_17_plen_313_part_00
MLRHFAAKLQALEHEAAEQQRAVSGLEDALAAKDEVAAQAAETQAAALRATEAQIESLENERAGKLVRIEGACELAGAGRAARGRHCHPCMQCFATGSLLVVMGFAPLAGAPPLLNLTNAGPPRAGLLQEVADEQQGREEDKQSFEGTIASLKADHAAAMESSKGAAETLSEALKDALDDQAAAAAAAEKELQAEKQRTAAAIDAAAQGGILEKCLPFLRRTPVGVQPGGGGGPVSAPMRESDVTIRGPHDSAGSSGNSPPAATAHSHHATGMKLQAPTSSFTAANPVAAAAAAAEPVSDYPEDDLDFDDLS